MGADRPPPIPPPIRIRDLAAPVLTDFQKASLAYGEGLEVDLSEAAVLAAARERTGLHDFGDDGFRARLRVWLQAADEDAGLNGIGRLSIRNHAVRILANRLRVEDLLARRPEILALPLPRPIIVAGLPRSGTTHLLNLMAADRRFRSVPYWESMEPVPVPGEGPGRDGRDPRYHRCRKNYEMMTAQSPLLKAMHDMPPDHIHEEIELLELDFGSYNLEWLAVVPRWRDHYLSLDLTSSYGYLRKVLQVLQYLRPGERFVLKCPQHLEQLGPLLANFPDATVAVTHRDPVAVIQSAVTMAVYGDRLRRKRPEPRVALDYWVDRIEQMLRACVRDRERVPADQGIDVLFHDFMADDVATVERIYALAGLPVTERARRDLQGFMQANPRGKHGRVIYDLEADFGVQPESIRKRFDFYFERFGVRPE